MDWYPYSLVLVPPGTMRAAVESRQAELFSRYDDLSAQAFTPGIRLNNFSRLPEDPGELRLKAAIAFDLPQISGGLLYLPLTEDAAGRDALRSLKCLIPPGSGASVHQPLVDGIPLCRIPQDAGCPQDWADPKVMRSGNFHLFCFSYLLHFDTGGTLIGAEEREVWRRPVRKPLAGNRKKQ